MAADLALVGKISTITNTCTTPAGVVSAGDTIIVVVSFDPTRTISTIPLSGSGSDVLTQVGTTVQGQGKLAVYAKENATGGASVSVQVNFSGIAFPTAHLVKATGVATASIDTPSLVQNATDAATPWTITSGTFAQANNVVLAAIEQNAGTAGAYASSNFTIISSEPDASTYWTSAVAKLVVTSTSAVTPSFTRTNSTNAACSQFVIGLKEAAAGGGTGKPWPHYARMMGA